MQIYGNVADTICGSPQIHKTGPSGVLNDPAATAAVTNTTPSAGLSDHSIISGGQCQALEIQPSSRLPITPEAPEALVLLTLLNQTHGGSDSSCHWLQWIFPKIASHTVGSGLHSRSQRGQVMQSGTTEGECPMEQILTNKNNEMRGNWQKKPPPLLPATDCSYIYFLGSLSGVALSGSPFTLHPSGGREHQPVFPSSPLSLSQDCTSQLTISTQPWLQPLFSRDFKLRQWSVWKCRENSWLYQNKNYCIWPNRK